MSLSWGKQINRSQSNSILLFHFLPGSSGSWHSLPSEREGKWLSSELEERVSAHLQKECILFVCFICSLRISAYSTANSYEASKDWRTDMKRCDLCPPDAPDFSLTFQNWVIRRRKASLLFHSLFSLKEGSTKVSFTYIFLKSSHLNIFKPWTFQAQGTYKSTVYS